LLPGSSSRGLDVGARIFLRKPLLKDGGRDRKAILTAFFRSSSLRGQSAHARGSVIAFLSVQLKAKASSLSALENRRFGLAVDAIEPCVGEDGV
jgi:hypothetical protein